MPHQVPASCFPRCLLFSLEALVDEAADLQRQLDDALTQKGALAAELETAQERLIANDDRIAGFNGVIHGLREPGHHTHQHTAALRDMAVNTDAVDNSAPPALPPAKEALQHQAHDTVVVDSVGDSASSSSSTAGLSSIGDRSAAELAEKMSRELRITQVSVKCQMSVKPVVIFPIALFGIFGLPRSQDRMAAVIKEKELLEAGALKQSGIVQMLEQEVSRQKRAEDMEHKTTPCLSFSIESIDYFHRLITHDAPFSFVSQVGLLRHQLHEALHAGPATPLSVSKDRQQPLKSSSSGVRSDAVAVDLEDAALTGGAVVDMGGTPSKPSRAGMAGGHRGSKASANQTLQGLVNCVQLVTDGRMSRQGSAVYLVVLHGLVVTLLLLAMRRC